MGRTNIPLRSIRCFFRGEVVVGNEQHKKKREKEKERKGKHKGEAYPFFNFFFSFGVWFLCFFSFFVSFSFLAFKYYIFHLYLQWFCFFISPTWLCSRLLFSFGSWFVCLFFPALLRINCPFLRSFTRIQSIMMFWFLFFDCR